MKTIWKFPLKLVDIQDIKLPIESQFLSCINQDDMATLYFIVNPELPKTRLEIFIYGTGNPAYPEDKIFLGTVSIGHFVWHIFSGQVFLPQN